MDTSSTLGRCNLWSCVIFVVLFYIAFTFLLWKAKALLIALKTKVICQLNKIWNKYASKRMWTIIGMYLTKTKPNQR